MDRQISCANLSQAGKFNTDAYIPRILNHLHRAKRNSAERRCRASHGEVVLLRHPWPELLGRAGRWGWQTWAQTHTHGNALLLPAAGRAQECTVWHTHTYTAPSPRRARHRQTSALVGFQSQLSNEAERLCRDYIPICQKKRCFPYVQWFAQEGMTFLPPLRIRVSFFRVYAMYLSHNSLLASDGARMSIQQNSFKDI